MFARYLIVGLVSNGILYLLFLFLIKFASAAMAMTICYSVGVAQTFVFNRNWTFKSEGGAYVFAKYVLCYLIGYIVNWLLIWFFVSRLSIKAELVQFFAIGVVACLIFFLQKFWVFKRGAL